MEHISNEDKAKEIAEKLGVDVLRNESGKTYYKEDVVQSALEAMEWKDEQFKGFLFELALKITTPKTDFDKALASAFPMAGLDTIDDVLTLLQNNWYDYQNKGTILNE